MCALKLSEPQVERERICQAQNLAHGTGSKNSAICNLWTFAHKKEVLWIYDMKMTTLLLLMMMISVRRSGPRNRKKTENWTGPDGLGPDRRLRLRDF